MFLFPNFADYPTPCITLIVCNMKSRRLILRAESYSLYNELRRNKLKISNMDGCVFFIYNCYERRLFVH